VCDPRATVWIPRDQMFELQEDAVCCTQGYEMRFLIAHEMGDDIDVSVLRTGGGEGR
jgi:hypothetical protein